MKSIWLVKETDIETKTIAYCTSLDIAKKCINEMKNNILKEYNAEDLEIEVTDLQFFQEYSIYIYDKVRQLGIEYKAECEWLDEW